MNEGPKGTFKICNPREGLCLLKSKSNSADLFPLAAAYPSTSVSCTIAPQSVSNSSWSMLYLGLHCCLKRPSPVTPLCHLIPDLLLLFFFNLSLNIPFCGCLSLWTPVVVLNMCMNSLTLLLRNGV